MRAYNSGYFHTVAYNLFVWHNQGGSFDKKDTKDLMDKNCKLLSQRYSDYGKLLDKSENNPLYQSIMFLARLIVFNKYAKESKIVIDYDFNTDTLISTKNTLLVVLSYNKLYKSYVLTQVYNDDVHILFDKDLDNLLYLVGKMEFNIINIKNLSGFKNVKKIETVIKNFGEIK